LYSPELSEIVCDSIYEATERYFADTVIHFSNKKTKKPIEPGYMYLDSVQNNQLYDSINNYLSILKQKSGKVETTVPDYFMQFLKDQNHRFGLLIFQYGFIKSDDFYKRQIAGTIIAALIARGNWFDLSEFHSELSCAIIDKQTSSLVYFGSVSSSKLPLSVAAQQDHFHWLFDRSLGIRSKKN
jgi:hypothetical protein